MNVLVACEFSGIVRSKFRDKGHNAWSCDIEPAEDKNKYHIQDDVLNHIHNDWDLIIAHPPCTYLANSGVRWLHEYPERWDMLDNACNFFNEFLKLDCKYCVENPIPHKYAKERLLFNYNQKIQPYEFGHYEQKATCLWLNGLPYLRSTNNVKHITKKLPDKKRQRLYHSWSSKDRQKIRSRTFHGIAEAMAEQWG